MGAGLGVVQRMAAAGLDGREDGARVVGALRRCAAALAALEV